MSSYASPHPFFLLALRVYSIQGMGMGIYWVT